MNIPVALYWQVVSSFIEMLYNKVIYLVMYFVNNNMYYADLIMYL
jgi:hypothetical protein